MEALEFLRTNKSKFGCFASNHFNTREEAVGFVEKLYKNGARLVEVPEDETLREDWRLAEEGGPYSATLLITIPAGEEVPVNVVIDAEKPDEKGQLNGRLTRIWWD